MNAPHLILADQEVPDTLARILADKYEEVRTRAAATPQSELERLARSEPSPRPFISALCGAVADGRVGLIAEIKRASPSGGLIRDPFDPAALAEAYCEGGATCLSVLTDAPYFQGSIADLQAARAACPLPVLRKDFMVHPWQIFESRAMGADCVLLIMAALADAQAEELEALAHSLDMAVLIEVHDQRELERALGLNSRLIGINNRNLKTLQTDIAITEKLAPLVPADRIPVAESGIRTQADVRRMAQAGARCLLVGEHLMRQPDVASAAATLVHAL
ncbi:indole-3-glycerol phosphate synthase [Siccirubricoccus deserti]|uniref:Indole-3-glycerol phosphate synthase n=1 Tax=Siccirubricoccus deserti TaxID=2013562 RepID=A0A9X0QYI1_9PROT|nr:indole-3-glycerol phosphate synthase TrpC [Siccirubricoccus deserti]MBC4016250.1 indole-3-glycerol phosphate synthase TrpC [Siccirubricoccus deserti]GGC48364.1 indole-3-glycerol phosphate synthase [Siccirubricoccus deserti]